MRPLIITERYMLYPLGLLNTFVIYTKRILKVLNPFWMGPLIVFIGPEGGGKTSNSYSLVERLHNSAIRAKRVYMGWHEFVIPFLSFLKKTDTKLFFKNESNPSNTSFKTTLRSLIIFLIYFFELFLRYWIKIYPARKIGVIVVTDRYFYDGLLLYDNIPDFLKKMMKFFIPRPTVSFYLTADPKILSIRKNEVPIKTLTKQLKVYEKDYKKFGCMKLSSNLHSLNKIESLINKEVIISSF